MDLIDCMQCGREPLPIGSDVWKVWWKAHWTDCMGGMLDVASLANLEVQ